MEALQSVPLKGVLESSHHAVRYYSLVGKEWERPVQEGSFHPKKKCFISKATQQARNLIQLPGLGDFRKDRLIISPLKYLRMKEPFVYLSKDKMMPSFVAVMFSVADKPIACKHNSKHHSKTQIQSDKKNLGGSLLNLLAVRERKASGDSRDDEGPYYNRKTKQSRLVSFCGPGQNGLDSNQGPASGAPPLAKLASHSKSLPTAQQRQNHPSPLVGPAQELLDKRGEIPSCPKGVGG